MNTVRLHAPPIFGHSYHIPPSFQNTMMVDVIGYATMGLSMLDEALISLADTLDPAIVAQVRFAIIIMFMYYALHLATSAGWWLYNVLNGVMIRRVIPTIRGSLFKWKVWWKKMGKKPTVMVIGGRAGDSVATRFVTGGGAGRATFIGSGWHLHDGVDME